MHFNIKNKMLEICFLHIPTFIIESFLGRGLFYTSTFYEYYQMYE